MAVVKEMMVGNTKISFYDDAYVNRTNEEIQRSWDRISQIYDQIYLEARAAGKDI